MADPAEVHRRIAYQLHDYWKDNDLRLQNLFRAFELAAGALVLEIVVLVVLVSGTI